MNLSNFKSRAQALRRHHEELVNRRNAPCPTHNGVFARWENPVVTADHAPLEWRYDFNPETNPYLMERLGVNAVCNAGAMKWQGKYLLVNRVEGNDRKSFFGIAESANGVDGFRFWDYPIVLPQNERPDTNSYDMRLTRHEDGFIYGLFCAERKDQSKPDDVSAADAQCGIARTQNLIDWERLPDLVTYSGQQRNVVLHPEFIDGQYAMYTRPQDGFINVGGGGGIGWGLTRSMEQPEIKEESIVDFKQYHTIKELKNGQGPPPLKTEDGWLHLAHGVRATAAGLRYVLYVFLTELDKPWQIKCNPGGYLIAPEGSERVGDVSNVAFCNGWIADEDGSVFIYYASADTRMHVATTSIAQLLDFAKNTPADGLVSSVSVQQRIALINRNKELGS